MVVKSLKLGSIYLTKTGIVMKVMLILLVLAVENMHQIKITIAMKVTR